MTIINMLEKVRLELVDQGLRNPLINYRPLRAKGLVIVDERPADIYNLIVTENRTMDFLHDPSRDNENTIVSFGDEIELEPYWYSPLTKNIEVYLLLKYQFIETAKETLLDQPDDARFGVDEKRFVDNHLQTPYSGKELQKRLLETHNSARTFIEEQGINVLFLTLGELYWYESENSSDHRRAPLVLIPIEISRKNAQARFTVRYTESGISGNISFREKLLSEFRLQLPMPETTTFEEEADFKLDAYFDAVRSVISLRDEWRVDAEAINIGFFSFGKFLMYNDLMEAAWPENAKPSEHPILQALLGEGFSQDYTYTDSLTHEELDNYLSHLNNTHILDADSSQTEAIYAVKRGRTLAIQGPPGTGKSQTIANIIAEAVGDKKTVLFVAEKMAALDVVKRRLDAVNAGDLCLELHSYKANRKSVTAELQRTLDLTRPQEIDWQIDAAEHKDARDKLNKYSEAVSQRIGQTAVAPYEAYGQLLTLVERLKNIDLPKWQAKDVAQWKSADYEGAIQQVQRLQRALKKLPNGISKNPFWGTRLLSITPVAREQISNEAADAVEALTELQQLVKDVAEKLQITAPNNLVAIETLTHVITGWDVIHDIPSGSLFSVRWLKNTSQRLSDILATGQKFEGAWQKISDRVLPVALTTDISPIRSAVEQSQSWFKRLLGASTKAQNALAAIVKKPIPTTQEQLHLLDEIQAAQDLEKQLAAEDRFMSDTLGTTWRGSKTDWNDVKEALLVFQLLLGMLKYGVFDEKIYQHLADWKITGDIRQSAQRIAPLRAALLKQIDSLAQRLDLDIVQCFGDEGYLGCPLRRLQEIFTVWMEETESIGDIILIKNIAEGFKANGLKAFFDATIDWDLARDYLEDFFNRNWYEQIIDRALRERSTLREFNGAEHNEMLEKFRQKDKNLLNHNAYRIITEHADQLTLPGIGQAGLLKSELGRKRGGKSIRKILAEAPVAVQRLKPVFMMSPMSVAAFLEPGKIEFDLVIFDEASQIRPADALGAILRGKQAVVVGDTKQMPPTSFFDSINDISDEDEDGSLSDFESILGLFHSKGVKNHMLRWHYRSRHESLIAVSNKEFYDSRLLIAPSATGESGTLGLKFNHLPETHYQIGGQNPGEARIVAEAIMEHARTNPDLTLGVAAFNIKQTQAIRDELEVLRRQSPETEAYFTAHPNEPFFVKNLENVQGDERDVIFISIGYGKKRDGRLSLNFGALNREGGERRLNVLISRARLLCKVFTNVKAGDIDLSNSNAIGIRALKAFLKYAETGLLELEKVSGREPDSPFEISVATKLRELGYRVDYQIGMSGFFIDLGVVDDANPGSYLAGVECDGASYHRSASARDRDRLRQSILESKGWKIIRIWSTDWFNNPARELQRVKVEIENAREMSLVQTPEPTPQTPTVIIREDVGTKVTSVPVYSKPYISAQLQSSYIPQSIGDVPRYEIKRLVEETLAVEAPIHIDELVRRIARALQFSRAGQNIRQTILNITQENAAAKISGEFVYASPANSIEVRDRSELPTESRRIDYVPLEELDQCITMIIQLSDGDVHIDEVVRETRNALGFKRVSREIEDAIVKRIRNLVQTQKLSENQSNLFSLPPDDK